MVKQPAYHYPPKSERTSKTMLNSDFRFYRHRRIWYTLFELSWERTKTVSEIPFSRLSKIVASTFFQNWYRYKNER